MKGFHAVTLPRVLSMAALCLSLYLMTTVYRSYSPTWDEPAHIGNGMAWITAPRHMIDPVDPPLPRVAVAVGPWLMGARFQTSDEPYASGNQILASTSSYRNVLLAARLAILPFYLFTVWLVWYMSRRWLGEWPAFVAVALLAFCPPVLAHSAIATTDVAFMAAYVLTLFSLWLVTQTASWRNCILAGVAIGLACSSKLAGIPFTLLSVVVLLLFGFLKGLKLPRLSRVAVIPVVAALTIWAAYRFQVGPMATSVESREGVARVARHTGFLQPAILGAVDHVPAYQFLQGILVARRFTHHPPTAYLFGQEFTKGRAYFFVVMLLTKTPIPFLLLGGCGLVVLVWQVFRGRDPFAIVPLTGILVPLAVTTFSHVYLGVRHVLSIYPFLAIAAGLYVSVFWQRARLPAWAKAMLVSGLLAWAAVDCIRAAPDLLPWYNEVFSPWAAYIHVDSDYDWGQDLGRLPAELRSLHAENVSLIYSGSADPNQFGMTSWHALAPGDQATGWVAVSEKFLRSTPDKFLWLDHAKQVGTAGKTIRIYYVTP
jgi:Dolichyl-phosphate-mannose-protein mannosyltransferase